MKGERNEMAWDHCHSSHHLLHHRTPCRGVVVWHRAVSSEKGYAMTRPHDESEFGGAPGMIQPPPHKMTGIEQARLERALDPADAEDTIEAASVREGNRQQ